MICSNCGTQNEASAKFCSSCGSPLSAPQQQTPPMAPPTAPPPAGATMAPPPTAPPGQAPYQAPMAAPGAAPPNTGKPYKAEFTMGLIGSIVGIVMFLIMLIVGLTTSGLGYYGYGYGFGGALIALTIVGSIFALVAFILGFVGTSKVGKGDGKGGITLIVGGGLGFIAMFFGLSGWLSIFFWPLLLAAGIMALARRKKVESGMY